MQMMVVSDFAYAQPFAMDQFRLGRLSVIAYGLLYIFLKRSVELYCSPMMNSLDHVMKYAHGMRDF